MQAIIISSKNITTGEEESHIKYCGMTLYSVNQIEVIEKDLAAIKQVIAATPEKFIDPSSASFDTFVRESNKIKKLLANFPVSRHFDNPPQP